MSHKKIAVQYFLAFKFQIEIIFKLKAYSIQIALFHFSRNDWFLEKSRTEFVHIRDKPIWSNIRSDGQRTFRLNSYSQWHFVHWIQFTTSCLPVNLASTFNVKFFSNLVRTKALHYKLLKLLINFGWISVHSVNCEMYLNINSWHSC